MPIDALIGSIARRSYSGSTLYFQALIASKASSVNNANKTTTPALHRALLALLALPALLALLALPALLALLALLALSLRSDDHCYLFRATPCTHYSSCTLLALPALLAKVSASRPSDETGQPCGNACASRRRRDPRYRDR